jgi:spoIIIJ-associated protein
MSEQNDAVEISAPSVEEAIQEALEKLGAAEDDVVIKVLSTPRAGVLGLGARMARVHVERRAPEAARSGVASPPPAPPPRARSSGSGGRSNAGAVESPPKVQHSAPPRSSASEPRSTPPYAAAERQAGGPGERTPQGEVPDSDDAGARRSVGLDDQVRDATAVLERILALMGEQATITTVEEDSEGIELAIKGDGSGLLIGRHGQTLDALEYLVNRILARRIRDGVPITVDTESYRERRRRQLHRMALSMSERAKRDHASVTLDPMPPRDRRIVHLALKDDPLLTTRSTGDGFLRTVEIIPVGERAESRGRPQDPGGGRRERGGGGRSQLRNRERGQGVDAPRGDEAPIGQQGGFQHGQKRIF